MRTLARGQCIQLYSQGGNCCAASGCRRCSNLLLLLSVSVCCTLIQVGPGNYISGGTRISQERGHLGGISRPTIKYREYPACGRYSQRYSVGGSSNAASGSQYCSNLLLLPSLNLSAGVLPYYFTTGNEMCRYNWHSSGFMGWSLPMLKYKYIF